MTAETVGVPSAAIARMAWGLACERAYGEPNALPMFYLKRREDASGPGANGWYYRIIDRIAMSQTP